ncbi:MAG: 1,4-alpha-glucan branching protein GlgB [Clostridia bacterium]|nr:1,4-alpha-glucan branching protein GlgB [Clostridia bacterium]
MKNDNMAAYLFHQGTNFTSYRYLGCHEQAVESGYLYTFRTWAPSADAVFVVGDFFGWDSPIPMQRITDRGVFECTVHSESSLQGSCYKYSIVRGGVARLKGDPYAVCSKGMDDGASIIYSSSYEFSDASYLEYRSKTVGVHADAYLPAPINIYEVHLGSFLRHEDGSYYSYRELAHVLVPYVKYMGYTHVELMPITEHPYDGSWGYQVGAFYAPTSRFGEPDDLRFLIDCFHRAGIGVIFDFVPAHFPKDAWGLYEFDGGPLYEYQGADRMESASWGTRFFDLGREEVQSFLISAALYYCREFHVDGLRVDAVASMLYLDYDRAPGQWIPNSNGGRENLEAIAFIKKMNQAVLGEFPDVLMIAEESTDFDGVTHPVSMGGLGFSMKWNMGWANDFYAYLAMDPVYRRYHHKALTFPLMYAFHSNYILPISHDEVVHGKASLIGKMHGAYEDKFLQLRAALLLQMTYPGKKMLFMGTEFAQFREWDFDHSLEWFMLDHERHRQTRDYVRALNALYLSTPALWELDFSQDGFCWLLPDEADKNLVAYERVSLNGERVRAVISFSGSVQEIYLPLETDCVPKELFCTWQGGDHAISYVTADGYLLRLPPFGGILLRHEEKEIIFKHKEK